MLDRIIDFYRLTRRFSVPMRLVALSFCLSLLATAFEVAGVGMLLPILEQLRATGANAIPTGAHWDVLRRVSDYTGIPLTLGVLLITSFVLLVGRQLLSYLNTLVGSVLHWRTADRIRRRVISSLLKADSGTQQRVRIGELASDVTTELERALKAIFKIFRSVAWVVQITTYLAGLLLLSWQMTLLSIGMIAGIGLVTKGLDRKLRETAKAISKANVKMTGFVVERLQRVRLIRLSGTEPAESKAFAQLSGRQVEQMIRQKLISAHMTLLPEPIAIGLGYSVLFVGSQVLGLELEALALFLLVLIRLMPLVKSIISNYNAIVGNWPAVQRVDGQLAILTQSRELRGGDKEFESLEQGITYENISFAYTDDDVPALEEVNITLPAHRMSALIGPSGAGKSTFVDLLPRLRDPSVGEISFDGTPIGEFSVKSLRAGIAFVPQQPQIFNISVAEHIRYGKEDASDGEVREAARLAGALDFVEALPKGFDTLLGDGGNRLSGGQRQRLDIARALVRRAPILILDEPTSALDAEAESAFREALVKLRKETDLTIIVIAHRLSTIADADQIIVLNKGRIEAAGSHEQLIKGRNWYATAYRKQYGVRKKPRQRSRQTVGGG